MIEQKSWLSKNHDWIRLHKSHDKCPFHRWLGHFLCLLFAFCFCPSSSVIFLLLLSLILLLLPLLIYLLLFLLPLLVAFLYATLAWSFPVHPTRSWCFPVMKKGKLAWMKGKVVLVDRQNTRKYDVQTPMKRLYYALFSVVCENTCFQTYLKCSCWFWKSLTFAFDKSYLFTFNSLCLLGRKETFERMSLSFLRQGRTLTDKNKSVFYGIYSR